MSDPIQRGKMGVKSHHYVWMYARFAHRWQQNRVVAFLAVNLLPHHSHFFIYHVAFISPNLSHGVAWCRTISVSIRQSAYWPIIRHKIRTDYNQLRLWIHVTSAYHRKQAARWVQQGVLSTKMISFIIHLDNGLAVFSSRYAMKKTFWTKNGTPWQRILLFFAKV